jgi:hypothetical protein
MQYTGRDIWFSCSWNQEHKINGCRHTLAVQFHLTRSTEGSARLLSILQVDSQWTAAYFRSVAEDLSSPAAPVRTAFYRARENNLDYTADRQAEFGFPTATPLSKVELALGILPSYAVLCLLLSLARS